MLGFLLLATMLPVISFPQHSPDVVARFNHAVELQRRGAFQEAEGEYRAVLGADPDYAEAHANLGAVLMRMDRYQDAIVSYQTALRLAPNLTPVLLNLGIAHYRKGEFEKTIETLKKFLQTSPDNAQAVQLAGLSLVELGRDREAIEFLNQAVASTPDDPAVLYAIGLASLRLRQPEFDRIVDHLAEVEGGRALSHLLRGQGFLLRLEWERAAQELETAGKLNPDLPRLQYSLGLSYFKLSRSADAQAAFQQELRRNPRDFSSLYYLANLQEAAGDIPAALQNLDKAFVLEPDSPEANTLLGKIKTKQGQLTEALKPLEMAVAKDPNDPEKRYLLARVYQQLGRQEDAIKQFAEVQRLKNEQLEKDRARMPKP